MIEALPLVLKVSGVAMIELKASYLLIEIWRGCSHLPWKDIVSKLDFLFSTNIRVLLSCQILYTNTDVNRSISFSTYASISSWLRKDLSRCF